MVAKSCSRSQAQPVLGVRSAAMISINRLMLREGVMHSSELGRADPRACSGEVETGFRRSSCRTGNPERALLGSDHGFVVALARAKARRAGGCTAGLRGRLKS